MTADSSRPVAYYPRYLTPRAAQAVAEAEAADAVAVPVPYTLTPQAEAELEAGQWAG
jgi:hypothetical protein